MRTEDCDLRWAVASIHERPIFWSLATNLGTTFKAPTNLGALALGLKLFLGKKYDAMSSKVPRSFQSARKSVAAFHHAYTLQLDQIETDWNVFKQIETN